MKKKSTAEMNDELRPEYDLRQLLKGGVRGKYAAQYQAGTNLVIQMSKLPMGKKRRLAKV